MSKFLILLFLPVAMGAHGTCLTSPAEMGDIGPAANLVCNELSRQFPEAALTVGDRLIHSPTAVSVAATVDGKPLLIHYGLAAASWTAHPSDLQAAR
jgi:hypothetical protein